MRATVFRDHVPPDRPPIRISVGEVVTLGARDTQWPAFVFVTTADGEGWVPARHIAADDGRGTITAAYDTSELAVVAGEQVAVIEKDTESGWWWCRNNGGSEGWIPATSFEALTAPADD